MKMLTALKPEHSHKGIPLPKTPQARVAFPNGAISLYTTRGRNIQMRSNPVTKRFPLISGVIGSMVHQPIQGIKRILAAYSTVANKPSSERHQKGGWAEANNAVCNLLSSLKDPTPSTAYYKISTDTINRVIEQGVQNLKHLFKHSKVKTDQIDLVMDVPSSCTLSRKFAEAVANELGLPITTAGQAQKETHCNWKKLVLKDINQCFITPSRFSHDEIHWLVQNFSDAAIKKWETTHLQIALTPEDFSKLQAKFPDRLQELQSLGFPDICKIRILRAFSKITEDDTTPISLNHGFIHKTVACQLDMPMFQFSPELIEQLRYTKHLLLIDDDVRAGDSARLLAKSIHAMFPHKEIEITFAVLFDGRTHTAFTTRSILEKKPIQTSKSYICQSNNLHDPDFKELALTKKPMEIEYPGTVMYQYVRHYSKKYGVEFDFRRIAGQHYQVWIKDMPTPKAGTVVIKKPTAPIASPSKPSIWQFRKQSKPVEAQEAA